MPDAPQPHARDDRETLLVIRKAGFTAFGLGLGLMVLLSFGRFTGAWAWVYENWRWYPTSGWGSIPWVLVAIGVLLKVGGRKRAAVGSYGLALLLGVGGTAAIWLLSPGTEINAAGFLPDRPNPINVALGAALAVAGMLAALDWGERIYTALVSTTMIAATTLALAFAFSVGYPLTPEADTIVNPLPPLVCLTLALGLCAASPTWPPITWLLSRTSATVLVVTVANIIALPVVIDQAGHWLDRWGFATASHLVSLTIIFFVLVEVFVAAQLLSDRDRWNEITELAAEAVMVTDENGQIVEVNETLATMVKAKASVLVGTNVNRWIAPRDRPDALRRREAWRLDPKVEVYPAGEVSLLDTVGNELPVELIVRPIYNRGQLFAVTAIRDASAITVLQGEKEAALNLLVDATDKSPVGQMLVGADGRIGTATRSLAVMLGLAGPTELLGVPATELFDPESRAEVEAMLASRTAQERDLSLPRRGGPRMWARALSRPTEAANGTRHTAIQLLDITDRVLAEQRAEGALADLEYRSTHDSLTGLPVRAVIITTIEKELARRGDADAPMALLYCDLDNFKFINDEYSHDAGDELLQQLAGRLLASAGDSATVGRMSGDEFVVVAPEAHSAGEAEQLAEDLIRGIAEEPFTLGLGMVFTSLSVGIALSDGAHDAEALLADADLALHAAKDSGKGTSRIMDDSLRKSSLTRARVARDLSDALIHGRITAWFQPIVRMRDRRVVGYEALARWRGHETGDWDTREWISVADEAGLLAPVGERIFAAVQDALPDLPEDIWVAVNMAGSQLTPPAVAAWLTQMRDSSVDPRRLVIEVTEASLTRAPTRTVRALEDLHDAGVRVVFDDFGRGHTSLTAMSALPISGIKLDQSFTRRVAAGDDEGLRLAQAIAGLAMSLGLETIAGAVETRAEEELLLEAGWDYGQGWLYGFPAPMRQPRGVGHPIERH